MTDLKYRIIIGDNLFGLRRFRNESIDLIYLDPPFFTGKDFSQFDDRWKDMDEYIKWMKERLVEMYRILKNTGSLYLHCDYHANSYLRIELDKIFGYDNLINEITWRRNNSNNNAERKFGCSTDTILLYAKSVNFTFNKQFNPPDFSSFRKIEKETGRFFKTSPLVVSGDSKQRVFNIGGRKYELRDGKRLKWTQETIDGRLKENKHLIYWTKNGCPRYKVYYDESKGIPVQTFWDDVKYLTGASSEHVGYPTQKPIALLDRIVKTSSNGGDVVLDPFIGSGTTMISCMKLGRSCYGIDINPKAKEITLERIGKVKNGCFSVK